MTSLLALALLAASPATGASEADRLFLAGKQAMKTQPAEACPLFERSFELDPALGTLLNLALCFELTDRPASAWLRFNQAREWATRTHEADRQKVAKEHSDALAPRLSWLALTAERPVPGLEVEVARQRLSLAAPASVPLDPGMVSVRASAPGFLPWTTSVQAPPPGRSTSVVVPPLEPANAAPGEPASELKLSDRPVAAAAPPAEVSVSTQPTHPTRVPGAALMASGAALTVFGIVSLAYSVEVHSRAQAQRLDAQSTAAPTVTRAEFDTAATLYPVSVVATIAGLAATGVGAWLFVRSPVSVSAAPIPGGAAVVAGGSW